MAGTATGWVEKITSAYEQDKQRKEREQKEKDSQDAMRLTKSVYQLTGVQQTPIDGRITITQDDHAMTFGLERPGSMMTAVFSACSQCGKEQTTSVLTAADVGRLFVEGYLHHDCQPTKS